MAYAPTLTVSADWAPSPRVLVTFTSVAATTQYINVTRVTEGRTFKVRGGVSLFAVGGASVMDFEPGFGVPNLYRAEMFTAAGVSLGFSDATSATIVAADVLTDTSMAAIHQPLKPSLAIQASMQQATADSLTYQNPSEIIYPEGATVGILVGGQRRGIQGMRFQIVCANGTDADTFLSMFGGYSTDFPAVLCIRTGAPLRIPRVFFAGITEVAEVTDYVTPTPFITFQMTATEVQPPAPGLVIPTLRRMDIDAAFATRAARAAAYATRLQRDTDYSKAGLAG